MILERRMRLRQHRNNANQGRDTLYGVSLEQPLIVGMLTSLMVFLV